MGKADLIATLCRHGSHARCRMRWEAPRTISSVKQMRRVELGDAHALTNGEVSGEAHLDWA
jgi:hypothetical protein